MESSLVLDAVVLVVEEIHAIYTVIMMPQRFTNDSSGNGVAGSRETTVVGR
jgi:hypothetical protein